MKPDESLYRNRALEEVQSLSETSLRARLSVLQEQNELVGLVGYQAALLEAIRDSLFRRARTR